MVGRHDPRVQRHEPRWPLQVGNGEFAVTVDVTGLQTFPAAHPHGSRHGEPDGTLLGTMSQWGWHAVPPPRPYDLAETLSDYRTADGRTVGYPDYTEGEAGPDGDPGSDAERWLRNNPHRLQLARIGFVIDGTVDDLTDVDQHLDLWRGRLTSRFTRPGAAPTAVTTVVHPDRDLLAVEASGDVPAIRLAFPYGSTSWSHAADWDSPDAHHTELRAAEDGWVVERRLDDTRLTLRITTSGRPVRTGEHELTIEPPDDRALTLVVEFLPGDPGPAATALPTVEQTVAAAATHWSEFWGSGAAVDLGAIDDPRAAELERRAVLSQYLTAVNATGSTPPAETGLVTNSWRGRFHLEMHWWHAAHAALWGRPETITAGLDWYATILDGARATARQQGYAGARWPKQVSPDGRESPGSIGPFLVWQQPHPIHLAELIRRASPDPAATDARYGAIVMASAEFMADVVVSTDRGFSLGPPLVPAQESYGGIRREVADPSFELAYWRWALGIAIAWRERLGLPPEPRWQEVADGMVRPTVRDGELVAIGVEPWTIRTDHPSMLCAYGFLPPTGLVEADVVSATFDGVLADWHWDSTWGWDYPVLAMTAARLQRGEDAVDALLMPAAKNEHGPNGHNWQTDSLPTYLPGNGGFLAALALMVAGWDGGPDRPGLPPHWHVRAEGFVRSPG